MPGWRCFLIEPTPFVRRSLRVYVSAAHLPCGDGCHDASVVIEPKVEKVKANPLDCDTSPAVEDFLTDPRWPTKCAKCGFVFPARSTEGDSYSTGLSNWQVNDSRLYAGFPDGSLRTLEDDLPPGAMYEVWWVRDIPRMLGPDGKCWAVQMPSGQPWYIDAESKSGGHWTRTGTPPNLDANPSINHLPEGGKSRYHGWLRNGVLTECCEGNKFPQYPFTA